MNTRDSSEKTINKKVLIGVIVLVAVVAITTITIMMLGNDTSETIEENITTPPP